MFDIGGGELILIILAIIVLFGPKKIPEIAQLMGKGIRKFNEAKSEFESEINNIKSDINNSVDIVETEANNNAVPSVKEIDPSDVQMLKNSEASQNVRKDSDQNKVPNIKIPAEKSSNK